MYKAERTQKWSIRKLTVGVASVVVASGYFLAVAPVASADTVAPTEIATESTSQPTTIETAPQPTAMEDTTTPATATDATVKDSVAALKDTVEVPADYLESAQYPGPFTAGVNQVIPYEAFGGDGMLTRLILKDSDTAKWSDNGADHNPALAPAENLGDKQYFYEVDLNGNTTGKENQELLDQLKANGTQHYDATVKVYGSHDQMADTTKTVATKNVSVNLHAVASAKQVADSVTNAIKDSVDVPVEYLENATQAAPFTAGVNQVIPYEAFGGDGMLTRLLLKDSDNAKWSDNGVDHNAPLLATEDLGHQRYFYEVDLNGNTTGVSGDDLLALLKKNGTQDYAATVKVYGAKQGDNGRVADLDKVIATRDVMVHLNGRTTAAQVHQESEASFNDTTTVPLSYVKAAVAPGPFTAGVNQVIPYEAFGGDGMLTRLLLKAAAGAAWSDNGAAMNKAILPLANLGHGQYFYEVDLDGAAHGKTGQALIDALRNAGKADYNATIKVYAAKDHQADLSNLVFEKTVALAIAGDKMAEAPMSSQSMPMTTPTHSTTMDSTHEMSMPMTTPSHMNNSDAMMTSSNTMTEDKMTSSTMPSDNRMMSSNATMPSDTKMSQVAAMSSDKAMMSDHKMTELPNTGAASTASTTVWGLITLAAGAFLGTLGFKRRSHSEAE